MRELMTQAEVDDDRDRWAKLRAGLITGTDVASILRVVDEDERGTARSAFGTPTDVYWDKVDPDPVRRSRLRWRVGTYMEPLLADLYREEYPGAVLEQRGLVVHDDVPWAAATLDMVRVDRGELEPVEFKTSESRRFWGDPPGGQIPMRYLVQAMWEGWIAGSRIVWVPNLRGLGFGFDVYVIDMRDGEVQADVEAMVEAVEQFRTDHLLAGKPPPVDWHESTGKTLKRVYRDVDLQAEAVVPKRFVEQWRRARAQAKRWDERAKLAEHEIRARMGPARSAVLRGGQLVAQRSLYDHRSIDVKALRRELPDVAAGYERATPVDRLVPKGPAS